MVPATQNIKIMRGDTEVFNISLKDSANVAINLSSSTFISQVRYERDSSTVAAAFTCVVTDPIGGVVTLTMTPVASAALNAGPAYWDLQRTEGGVVNTILSGKCTILADVSRV
jgi:hypothetical protein